MWRIIKWAIGVIAVQTAIFFLLELWLPGLDVRGVTSTLLGGMIITGVSGAVWPLIYRVSARFHPLLFPVLTFVLSGVAILLAVRLVDRVSPAGIYIENLQTAIIIWVALSFGSTLLGAFFSLNDAVAYDRFVTGPLRRSYLEPDRSDSPGFIFLEIDGLSEPAFRKALAHGYMPTLQRWISSGSHTLTGWEPDLSSQTSASQAGILLGSNQDIPAFRWWDKPRGKLMQSSSMSNVADLEAELSSGYGLLAGGGASRWNIFSGDAVDSLGTLSKVGDPTAGGRRSYYAYFSNPYSISRTAGLFVADVVREWFQSLRQRVLNVQPRVHRGFVYAFIRAGTTVLLSEASRFMLTADIFRGFPSVYCTFFAYDEVAHHSGTERKESFQVLRMLDRMIAHIERVSREGPRPYHLVVLSDHGQTQGATFKQRYGMTLAELVHNLLARQHAVSSPEPVDEGLAGLRSALTEAAADKDRPIARLARRASVQLKQREELTEPARRSPDEIMDREPEEGDVVVLASGNLGLVSFTRFEERLTLEWIDKLFPALLPGLANFEGISFIMVHSDVHGGVVIGGEGMYYLDRDVAEGQNPLSRFGPNAARHLRRTNSFSNAPDILVMSMFDERTNEVAAFEELVGSHGGLGGPQTEPFVLYPAEFESQTTVPIVGAAELYNVMRNWIAQADGSYGRSISAR